MRTVVTGGSGLVGKNLKKIMPDAIYLSSSDFDLRHEHEIYKMFDQFNPERIVHLAARVGGISDNIARPATYIQDNVLMNTLLLNAAVEYEVKSFMGILSTCIYPDVSNIYPMRESDLHSGPPTPTNFSYAYAKRLMAVQIDAINEQYNKKYNYLIPCNLYGAEDKDDEIKSHFVTALLKKIQHAKINNEKSIILYGTGKPLRQFMHASDLARVIKYCLENNITDSFNIATDENYSIEEIAKIALSATNSEHLTIEFDASKPDGQYRKDVSTDRIKGIIPNFETISLLDGIRMSYDWELNV